MNPLEEIKSWYESLNEEVQTDIAALTTKFHPDQIVRDGFGDSKMTLNFKNYLNSSSLNDSEIVQRTLFIIKLISFSFANRTTEEDWTRVLDTHLDYINNLKENNQPTDFFENLLNKLPQRKSTWIATFNEWSSLINNELSDKNIADWFYTRLDASLKK